MSQYAFLNILVFLALLGPQVLRAQTAQKEATSVYQSTKFSIFQQEYGGANYSSLANGSNSQGIEISTDRGGTFFRYFVRAHIAYSEGKKSFLNGTTPFSSNYRYTQFAPEVGISLFPIPRRLKAPNLYLWGSASVSYNGLEIKNMPTTTTLRNNDQALGYGYSGGVAFEYIISTYKSGSVFLVNSEVGYRNERTNLMGNNNFDISGLVYSIGFGF